MPATDSTREALIPSSYLAAEMLREIRDQVGGDERALAGDYRSALQANLVGQYLQAARAVGLAAEDAFLAVLSDFMGACLDGACPEPESYYPRGEACHG